MVSSEPSLLQVEQPQLFQPFLIAEVFHSFDHFCGPPLDPLQQVHVCPVLKALELHTGLQVESHQGRVEGWNPLTQPASHASFDAAQDTVGLLGCEQTLPGRVELPIQQHAQLLFLSAALNSFSTQPVFVLGMP